MMVAERQDGRTAERAATARALAGFLAAVLAGAGGNMLAEVIKRVLGW